LKKSKQKAKKMEASFFLWRDASRSGEAAEALKLTGIRSGNDKKKRAPGMFAGCPLFLKLINLINLIYY